MEIKLSSQGELIFALYEDDTVYLTMHDATIHEAITKCLDTVGYLKGCLTVDQSRNDAKLATPESEYSFTETDGYLMRKGTVFGIGE